MLVLRDPVALVDHLLNVRYGRRLFQGGRRTDAPKPPPYPTIDLNGVRYLPPRAEQYLYLLTEDAADLLRLRTTYERLRRKTDPTVSAGSLVQPVFLLRGNHVLLRRDLAPEEVPTQVSPAALLANPDADPSLQDSSFATWQTLTLAELVEDMRYRENHNHACADEIWQFRAVIYDPHALVKCTAGGRLSDAVAFRHLRLQYFCPFTWRQQRLVSMTFSRLLPFSPEVGLTPAVQRLLSGNSDFKEHVWGFHSAARFFPPQPPVAEEVICTQCRIRICFQGYLVEGACICWGCASLLPGRVSARLPGMTFRALRRFLDSGTELAELLEDCLGPPPNYPGLMDSGDDSPLPSFYVYPRAAGGQWCLFTPGVPSPDFTLFLRAHCEPERRTFLVPIARI